MDCGWRCAFIVLLHLSPGKKINFRSTDCYQSEPRLNTLFAVQVDLSAPLTPALLPSAGPNVLLSYCGRRCVKWKMDRIFCLCSFLSCHPWRWNRNVCTNVTILVGDAHWSTELKIPYHSCERANIFNNFVVKECGEAQQISFEKQHDIDLSKVKFMCKAFAFYYFFFCSSNSNYQIYFYLPNNYKQQKQKTKKRKYSISFCTENRWQIEFGLCDVWSER